MNTHNPNLDIVFRGKTDTGIWVTGNLFQFKPLTGKVATYITSRQLFDGFRIEVFPSTVGFFTGLYDGTKFEELSQVEQFKFLDFYPGQTWKGKPIFTGDIIEFEDAGEDEYGDGYDFMNRGEIIFDSGRITLGNVLCSSNSAVCGELRDMTYYNEFITLLSQSKIIGNIHDNPELVLQNNS